MLSSLFAPGDDEEDEKFFKNILSSKCFKYKIKKKEKKRKKNFSVENN